MLLPKRKQCSKCKRKLPATTEFFHKDKKKKYGLSAYCKSCHKQWREQYYRDNKDKELAKCKKYREKNKEKQKEYNKKYKEKNKEKQKEYNKKYREKNKEKIKEKQKEYNKKYYENNRDKEKEYKKQYYENNKEEILEKRKEHYENNKEEIKEYKKQYREDNPDKFFNYRAKRRQLEENQGNGLTKEQWFELMNFFEWECAYSGIQLNKDNRTIDHIVPLNKGGLNEIWNCVPMYKPYNSSKNASDMLEWYQQQVFYSEERLNKIYEWQEYAYNKWGNDEAM